MIVLRIRPPRRWTRSWNHRLSAEVGWFCSHSQASSTIVVLSRGLPALDTLLVIDRAALPWRRRQAGVGGHLPADQRTAAVSGPIPFSRASMAAGRARSAVGRVTVLVTKHLSLCPVVPRWAFSLSDRGGGYQLLLLVFPQPITMQPSARGHDPGTVFPRLDQPTEGAPHAVALKSTGRCQYDLVFPIFSKTYIFRANSQGKLVSSQKCILSQAECPEHGGKCQYWDERCETAIVEDSAHNDQINSKGRRLEHQERHEVR